MADAFWEQLRSTPEGIEATDREVEAGLAELEWHIIKAKAIEDLGVTAAGAGQLSTPRTSADILDEEGPE